jgi:energy-coupling factor transport system permease protein
MIFRNPLVRLWFFLWLVLAIFLAQTVFAWGVNIAIFTALLIQQRRRLPDIFRRIKPVVAFLPGLLFLYILFSLWLTDENWVVILRRAGFTGVRLTLVMGVMLLYFTPSGTPGVLTALRSLWLKLNRPWRWVEDFFLFLGLTLRFYPTFQQEWEHLQRAHRALGLQREQSRLERLKQIVRGLPGMFLYQYRRADDLALVMQVRGYGYRIPRGVANPVPFTYRDGLYLLAIPWLFLGILTRAPL